MTKNHAGVFTTHTLSVTALGKSAVHFKLGTLSTTPPLQKGEGTSRFQELLYFEFRSQIIVKYALTIGNWRLSC